MESQLLERVDYLIELGNKTRATYQDTVDQYSLSQFRSATLSFLVKHFGEEHPYYKEFNSQHEAFGSRLEAVENSLAILQSIKDEISKGWNRSVRGLVSAEVFSDFIEMAQHLLDEGYKDAAAVMLGSTLEEHLRQLCRDYKIPTTTVGKNGKVLPLMGHKLNEALAGNNPSGKIVYGKLDQKSVDAWLAIRNSAAHGKYSEYTKEQVQLLATALADFMVRTRGER